MSIVNVGLTDQEVLFAAILNGNFSGILTINVHNEDLTVLTDGIEVTFNVASRFVPGSLRVYLGGARVRKDVGTPNFVVNVDDDNNGKSFTMSTAPTTGQELIIDYQRSNNI